MIQLTKQCRRPFMGFHTNSMGRDLYRSGLGITYMEPRGPVSWHPWAHMGMVDTYAKLGLEF